MSGFDSKEKHISSWVVTICIAACAVIIIIRLAAKHLGPKIGW